MLVTDTYRPMVLPTAPRDDPYQDPIAVAVVRAIGDLGYEAVTIEEVCRRAEIGRGAFHLRFDDLEECALKTYEVFSDVGKRRLGTAYNTCASSSHSAWSSMNRVSAAIGRSVIDARSSV